MKKISILLAALFAATSVTEAQVASGYGFEQQAATLEMLAYFHEATFTKLITKGAPIETNFEYIFSDETVATSKWGGTTGKAFEIGFDFPFAGDVVNYFVPSVGGSVKLGKTEELEVCANGYFLTNENTAYDNTVFLASENGLLQGATYEMGYLLAGEAPNRVLLIAYKHYGIASSSWADAPSDSINCAIALCEDGNILFGINGTSTLSDSYTYVAGVRGNGSKDITCIGGAFDTVSHAASAEATLSSAVTDNTVFMLSYPTDVVAPTTQPTAFEASGATASEISASFTAAEADYYLVVASEGALDAVPEAKKSYETGDVLGNGTVIDFSPNTSFVAEDLKASTDYTFTIFAANFFGANGPQYNTVDPLVGTANTTPGKPGALEIYLNTTESLTLDVNADEAGDQVFVVVSDTTHNPGNYGVRAFHGEISSAYKTGDDIDGGGKVAYFGPATDGLTLNGLEAGKEYFFLAYSYSEKYGFSVEPDTVMAKAVTTITLPWAYTSGANNLYEVPAGWESNLSIAEASNFGTLVSTDPSGYQLWTNYTYEPAYVMVSPMYINQTEAVFSFDFASFTWSRFTTPNYNAYTWKDEDKLYAVVHTSASTDTIALLDGESFVEPDSLAFTNYTVDLSKYYGENVTIEVVFDVTSSVYVVMENFKAAGKDVTTSISKVENVATESKSYDLQGRRATKATGLMIKDGKVIMVK